MFVCLSVMGLRLKYMGLCIVYVPLRMPSCGGMEIEVDERWLTAQQKDERRQDNGDKKNNLRVSTLLHSLNYERDRGRTARHCLDSASSFAISSDRTFHMLGVRQMMRMRIPTMSLVEALVTGITEICT